VGLERALETVFISDRQNPSPFITSRLQFCLGGRRVISFWCHQPVHLKGSWSGGWEAKRINEPQDHGEREEKEVSKGGIFLDSCGRERHQ
jgi:hypothetical protein